MTIDAIITALSLPGNTIVNQRVPKKMLVDQGAPTPADKRQLQDGIEELVWVAALKPTNIGVPAYRDDVREYLEIAVISVTLRPTAKVTRLIEMIHRAIPYPVFLVTQHRSDISVSLAPKRFSEGQGGKIVVDEIHNTGALQQDAQAAEFLASIALARMPTSDMHALYQGWCDRVAALEAARITGVYVPTIAPERAVELREGLAARAQLQRELAILRAQATREKQLNRRVELNLNIKRLEAELAAIVRGF